MTERPEDSKATGKDNPGTLMNHVTYRFASGEFALLSGFPCSLSLSPSLSLTRPDGQAEKNSPTQPMHAKEGQARYGDVASHARSRSTFLHHCTPVQPHT
jgi:hypothetical protein